jgi:DNA-binding protein HU-beta
MNKADFLTGVASKADLSKKDAETALNAVLAQLSDAFSKGEDVAFIGFGTFKVATRKARTGRNPGTGKEIQIPESKTVTFKVGAKLKEML